MPWYMWLALAASLVWLVFEMRGAFTARCKCGSYDVPDDETMCLNCLNALHVEEPEQGRQDEGVYRRKF